MAGEIWGDYGNGSYPKDAVSDERFYYIDANGDTRYFTLFLTGQSHSKTYGSLVRWGDYGENLGITGNYFGSNRVYAIASSGAAWDGDEPTTSADGPEGKIYVSGTALYLICKINTSWRKRWRTGTLA